MIAALIAGCGLGPEPLGAGAWVELAGVDPLAAHRPADPDCEFGWWVEDGVLEVDTGLCGYLALEQPLVNDLWPGEALSAVFAHDDLVAAGPARAHAALLIDGALRWELELELPQADGVHAVEIAIEAHVPSGASVLFHLHNHGANNYRLFPLERREP